MMDDLEADLVRAVRRALGHVAGVVELLPDEPLDGGLRDELVLTLRRCDAVLERALPPAPTRLRLVESEAFAD